MKINCRTQKHKSHFPRGIAVWTHLHSVCLCSVYKIVMWYMSYLFIMTLWYKLFPFSIFLCMEFHGFLISDLHTLFWNNFHVFYTRPKDIYVTGSNSDIKSFECQGIMQCLVTCGPGIHHTNCLLPSTFCLFSLWSWVSHLASSEGEKEPLLCPGGTGMELGSDSISLGCREMRKQTNK